MIETQSPDRAYIHEAIEHVGNLGYLTLIERRVLLRNTIKILRQSQNIDQQPLPDNEEAELKAAPKLISPKEHSIASQIGVFIGQKRLSRKYCRKSGYVTPLSKRNEALIGMGWYNNGKQNRKFRIAPAGWKPGQLRKRILPKPKPVTRHWFTNGRDSKQFPIKGQIPKGWKLGRVVNWKTHPLRKAA